ncbi:TPA: 4-alpha-glucanotransferase [Candidatus Galligastranaerophilus intestinigallinarum]|nr:4-alpha-glucanotransferase [Candidatus Galligastranaerophilus intestinigallinarum]
MQTTEIQKISKEYKKTLSDALKVLGKKHMALICHGVSFPALEGENTGFGTYNSNAAKKLFEFVGGIFNVIQLGPNGKTKSSDPSPYTGTVFSQNPLFADLKSLTENKWHKLLSVETFNKIVESNPKKGENRAAYSYAIEAYKEAFDEIYKNYLKLNDKNFKKEFENFKKENAYWLDTDALYEALSIENNSEYWPKWKNELDKNLFYKADKKEADKRIDEINKKYKDVIEEYKLIQFILAKQGQETKEYTKRNGLKMIADRQVAFSDRDCWAYQSLFLDGWSLGCPPDYFSKDGQAWDFNVMDPEKLFNPDGTLGKGGELLKKLYLKMFKENPGGVRIDHTVGLIDPWVYKKGCKPKVSEGAGRLYSSPNHPELSKYSIISSDDTDPNFKPDEEKWVKNLSDEQIKLYGRMIEKIVIQSAIEAGLDKSAIVAEDLGTLTNPVVKVMEKYGLAGMKLVQFVIATEPDHPYRCKNIVPNSWAMTGTHDNRPIRLWAKDMINTEADTPHVNNLMADLYSEFDGQDMIRHKLYTDDKFLAFSKLVEVFASKAENIQIFFTDFFGLQETYNVPGTSGDKNWSLRIPDNFEEVYYNNLQNFEALNLPLALSYAIKARGREFANQNKELLEKLESLA